MVNKGRKNSHKETKFWRCRTCRTWRIRKFLSKSRRGFYGMATRIK